MALVDLINALTAGILVMVVLRTIHIYLGTKILDYLILGSAYLFLLLNAIARLYFGFRSLYDSLTGIVVLNLLMILFFRVTNLKIKKIHWIILTTSNIIYALLVYAELIFDGDFMLLRQFTFNLDLLFIAVYAQFKFLNVKYIRTNGTKNPIQFYFYKFLMTVFFLIAFIRIFVICGELTGNPSPLLSLITDLIVYLVFLFTAYTFYLAILHPEFLLFSHQQIVRAMQTAKVIRKMEIPEERPKYQLAPDEVVAYLKLVARTMEQEENFSQKQ